jgi:ribosomal protein L11 methyltransferase
MTFYVVLSLPSGLAPEARDSLSELVTRLASRFSFQGLEDWTVDVKKSRVLGAESEFHDLTRAGRRSREMRVYFAKRPDAALFARILRQAFADLRVGAPRRVGQKDWMKAWRRHYKVQVIREGRRALAVVPSWKKAPKRGVSVRISPGQAFGTGTHATTQLCLRLLLRHAPGARRVLDFGAGTGVLLLAAQKLAGAKGLAVESDPVALAQARKNARLNRASGLRFAREVNGERFDLVFANVLAPVLLAHRAKLRAALAPEGLLFLSGILRAEAGAFLKQFGGTGLELVERLDQGDWSALALRRASGRASGRRSRRSRGGGNARKRRGRRS